MCSVCSSRIKILPVPVGVLLVDGVVSFVAVCLAGVGVS